MDVDLLAHVELFEAGCTSPQERAHAAPYRSVLALVTGVGSPLDPIEQALAVPGLSPQLAANLQNYRSVWSNTPEPGDIEAARHAVRAARDANTVWVPLVQSFLAMALRRDHPDEAMAVAQAAVEGDLDAMGPFGRATVVVSIAITVVGIPVAAAAGHLRDRLTGLQATLTGPEKVYFAVCANVLSRAGHPAAAVVRSFVLNNGLAPVYARLLPDLPTAPAPQDMHVLIEIIRCALDDVLSAAAET